MTDIELPQEKAPEPILRAPEGVTPTPFNDGIALQHTKKIAAVIRAIPGVDDKIRASETLAIAVVLMASAMNENPLYVALETSVTAWDRDKEDPKLEFSSSFIIGRATRSGLLRGPITYETSGDLKKGDFQVTAKAVWAADGTEIATTLTSENFKTMGMYPPKNQYSYWNKHPEHMAMLRAGVWLVRRHMWHVIGNYCGGKPAEFNQEEEELEL